MRADQSNTGKAVRFLMASCLQLFAWGCSFPDPTFVDTPPGAVGGSGSGGGAGSAGQAGMSQPVAPLALAREQGEVLALTADSDEVVWISPTSAGTSAQLRAVPSQGGEVSVLLEDEPNLLKARAMELDSSTFFFAYDRDLVHASRVEPVPASFFDPTDVSVLLAGASQLYLGAPWGVARFPKGGAQAGGLVLLADEGAELFALEGETALIWLPQSLGGDVRAVPGDGATVASAAPVVVSEPSEIGGLAYDDTGYYFSVPDAGVVRWQARDRSVLEAVAEGESLPGVVVVTRAAIYWISDSGQALRRLSKASRKVVTIGSARPDLLKGVGDAVFWVSGSGDLMTLRD